MSTVADRLVLRQAPEMLAEASPVIAIRFKVPPAAVGAALDPVLLYEIEPSSAAGSPDVAFDVEVNDEYVHGVRLARHGARAMSAVVPREAFSDRAADAEHELRFRRRPDSDGATAVSQVVLAFRPPARRGPCARDAVTH